MAKYPEKPKRISGYTEQWIGAFLTEHATARQISRYIKAIEGKSKAEQREIFVSMFIDKENSFANGLRALAKKKRTEEKAKKQEQGQE